MNLRSIGHPVHFAGPLTFSFFRTLSSVICNLTSACRVIALQGDDGSSDFCPLTSDTPASLPDLATRIPNYSPTSRRLNGLQPLHFGNGVKFDFRKLIRGLHQ